MSNFICNRCRATLQRTLKVRKYAIPSTRTYSAQSPTPNGPLDIAALLSKPTWSVRSLAPRNPPAGTEITPQKLHHLLRLSALPLPKTAEEEASMLAILHSQLHFVQDIQNVDTEGLEPLQSIRDETEEGIKDVTIGLEELREALGKEDVKGRNGRPRRRKEVVDAADVEGWDVLGTAGEKVETPGGRFFVVRSGKGDSKGEA